MKHKTYIEIEKFFIVNSLPFHNIRQFNNILFDLIPFIHTKYKIAINIVNNNSERFAHKKFFDGGFFKDWDILILTVSETRNIETLNLFIENSRKNLRTPKDLSVLLNNFGDNHIKKNHAFDIRRNKNIKFMLTEIQKINVEIFKLIDVHKTLFSNVWSLKTTLRLINECIELRLITRKSGSRNTFYSLNSEEINKYLFQNKDKGVTPE